MGKHDSIDGCSTKNKQVLSDYYCNDTITANAKKTSLLGGDCDDKPTGAWGGSYFKDRIGKDLMVGYDESNRKPVDTFRFSCGEDMFKASIKVMALSFQLIPLAKCFN